MIKILKEGKMYNLSYKSHYLLIAMTILLSCNTTKENIVEDKNIQRIDEKFIGDWIGSIKLNFRDLYADDIDINDPDILDGKIVDLRINISANSIKQYFFNIEALNNEYPDDESFQNAMWRLVKPEKEYYIYDGNNLIYGWLNIGGVWTENQTFNLSIIDNELLFLVWTRHVNNNFDDADNNVWHEKKYITLSRTENNQLNHTELENDEIAMHINQKFIGIWSGEINIDNKYDKIDIRANISENEIILYLNNKIQNSNYWSNVIPEIFYYCFLNNNMIYIYTNKNSNKSDAYVYSFSIINDEVIDVVYSYILNEHNNDKKNKIEYRTGEGKLRKLN
jgi:hypothetical protein